MPLPRPTFKVELESQPDVTHTVQVRPCDQIMAEQAGARFGMGPISGAPLAYSMMWTWAALVRQGDYQGDWPTFQRDMLVCEGTESDAEELPMVDPTGAGLSTDSP